VLQQGAGHIKWSRVDWVVLEAQRHVGPSRPDAAFWILMLPRRPERGVFKTRDGGRERDSLSEPIYSSQN